jgi:aconitase A
LLAGIMDPLPTSNPIDARTFEHLRSTGRPRRWSAETYARRQSLWFEPAAELRQTDVIEIQPGSIDTSIAGPRRLQAIACRHWRPFNRSSKN